MGLRHGVTQRKENRVFETLTWSLSTPHLFMFNKVIFILLFKTTIYRWCYNTFICFKFFILNIFISEKIDLKSLLLMTCLRLLPKCLQPMQWHKISRKSLPNWQHNDKFQKQQGVKQCQKLTFDKVLVFKQYPPNERFYENIFNNDFCHLEKIIPEFPVSSTW